MLLTITDLRVAVEGRTILDGLSLDVPAGEVHAIMGPNGAGKSTLAYALAGREGYEILGGSVLLDGREVLGTDPEERARAGLFLSFQYPLEIAGLSTMTFLKAMINANRRARGEADMAAGDVLRLVRDRAAALRMDPEMLKRPLNVGFSGGEKKRMEILQMMLQQPRFAILDETDSGLDIDALRIVADGVNAMRAPDRGMLVITHYQRLLDHVRPDRVHVLVGGRVVETGGPDLAERLEGEGYDRFLKAA